MVGDLLQTKLYAPRKRQFLVSRFHLIERLNEGLVHKLTLVSAPAGFGITTLVSNWVAECDWLTAWLLLVVADSVPRRLW